ncbi:DUF4222 domain-containing protein [Escherichia coli]|uniref:DUF4222 domain-containing protein n=1 Tax=Escherichia coli TaxID=562 RepID=UPI0016B9AA11|nr:DUF4222 domain-containing protein [Escherichia coli]EFK4235243.1 DUF4222 domain-containing protein [Escherichia coli]EGH1375005.1 DUF4222 domain-containing protein [Escherichia coli]EGH1412059.1 DUF4222 domain-containing protein [Escherichia coli]HCU1564548.1 DUF4222 domain-containing protein [Escherichia coli]
MSEDIPLPKINQRYRDDHGALVTVTSVEETRVVFMRDGYPHPCMRPMYNFLGKFKRSIILTLTAENHQSRAH